MRLATRDADELDRLAGDGAHRQGRTAAGIAVHAGQDDAGDAEALVKGAGGVDRVLAGERVGDEEHLVRSRRGLHLGGLGHQALVHRGAAGGVEHHHVEAAEAGGVHGALGDLHRRLSGHDRQALDADLLGQHRELLHRGRAACVEGGEQHLALLAVGEAPGDLGGGRGLARALQADHQDRHRGGGVEIDGLGVGAEHRHELVVDDLHDHLAGRHRLEHDGADGLLLHPVGEAADHLEGDVGLQQGAAHLAHGGGDVGLGQGAPAGEPREDAGEAVGQAFEHALDPRLLFEPGALDAARLEGGLEAAQGAREFVPALRVAEAHHGAVVERQRVGRDRLARPRAGLVDRVLDLQRFSISRHAGASAGGSRPRISANAHRARGRGRAVGR
jgi:hypothetical protein